ARPDERCRRVDLDHRQPPACGGDRVARAGVRLLALAELGDLLLPGAAVHDRWHGGRDVLGRHSDPPRMLFGPATTASIVDAGKGSEKKQLDDVISGLQRAIAARGRTAIGWSGCASCPRVRLWCAMICAAGRVGVSSVVWPSATRVTSKPSLAARRQVASTQSSVCTPAT